MTIVAVCDVIVSREETTRGMLPTRVNAHVSIAKCWVAVALLGAVVAATWASPARAGGEAVAGWTTAKAIREARRARLVVDGRRVRVDPAALVCWGAGSSVRRGATRLWRRFDCIAPTFHGAGAGPDLLFDLRPLGDLQFATVNARFSAYQATTRVRNAPPRSRPPRTAGAGGHSGLSAVEVAGLVAAALLVAAAVAVVARRPRGRRTGDAPAAS
jgi:hypothetical protein